MSGRVHLGICFLCFFLDGVVSSFYLPSQRTNHLRRRQKAISGLMQSWPSTCTFKSDFELGKILMKMGLTRVKVLVEGIPDTGTARTHEHCGSVAILLPSIGADVTPSRFGSRSPVGTATISEAAKQLVRKIMWFSAGKITGHVFNVPINEKKSSSVISALEKADALVVLHLTSVSDLRFAAELFSRRRKSQLFASGRSCQFALECVKDFAPVVGPFDVANPSLTSKLLPWTSDASGSRMAELMQGLFDRWTSDDFTVALMLFFNQFSGSRLDWVKYSVDASWEKGPWQNVKEFSSMISKCGDCIVRCVADDKCRKCLETLTALDTRDQVASYRTIVSFESDLLKDFSYCILQKNNIFECEATIPMIPRVEPTGSWRGKKLMTDDAKKILIAHLDDEAAPLGSLKMTSSWKVAAGANVAYDQFPSQHQLFYESVNGRDMWYDPVFRVETIDGRNVWAKRHYKVRNGSRPGTFQFSVLDNGVTSNEFWTIVGVADDLSWIVFHYAGAAGAVGQSYLGGLLCTPDGSLPPEDKREEIWDVFRAAGIEPWELYVVDNNMLSPGAIEAGPPPLDFFRRDVLDAKARKGNSDW